MEDILPRQPPDPLSFPIDNLCPGFYILTLELIVHVAPHTLGQSRHLLYLELVGIKEIHV
jgi:hypothetical protein